MGMETSKPIKDNSLTWKLRALVAEERLKRIRVITKLRGFALSTEHWAVLNDALGEDAGEVSNA